MKPAYTNTTLQEVEWIIFEAKNIAGRPAHIYNAYKEHLLLSSLGILQSAKTVTGYLPKIDKMISECKKILATIRKEMNNH